MSFVGKLVGKLTGADSAAKAAAKAGKQQAQAAQAGIDKITGLMQPYIESGMQGMAGMEDLLGLNGADKQAAAIAAIQSSPQFSALLQQGEDSILANASATGGLRGGNTQAALGQFSPALLSSLIEQQYSRLGGLAGMGYNAASNTGSQVAALLGQQGAALAGGTLAKGSVASQGFGTLLGLGGAFLGAGGLPGIQKAFGFGGTPIVPATGGPGMRVPTGFKF